MSMRKQQSNCEDKEQILNRSVRPSSFKLFEKRQIAGGSPQDNNNSRHFNHTTNPTSNHRRSRADSGRDQTHPSDSGNCFGGLQLPTLCSGQCEQRWKSLMARLSELESKLQLTNLKLQESVVTKDLESTKQLDTFNRLINLEKRAEKIEYNLWEMRQISKTDKQDVDKLMQKMTNSNQELKMDAKLLEQKVDQLQNNQSPEDLRQKIQHIRSDQNRKLKSMYEALEDMGNLQASVVESVNGLKYEIEKSKGLSVNYMHQTYNKQNMTRYNTTRYDEHWKGTNRKNSHI